MPTEGAVRERSRSPKKGAASADCTDLRPERLDALTQEFLKDGTVMPLSLFSEADIAHFDTVLTKIVKEKPDDLGEANLLNLHWTSLEVLELCRHPHPIAVAKKFLRTEDVSIFTSRILCKSPGTGAEIPWHQDSFYWPLIPPGADAVQPTVASMWLTVDDVLDRTVGAMQVLPFTAQPETKDRNVTELLEDSGDYNINDDAYDKFNLTIDKAKLNENGARWVWLRRGQCEWHTAFNVHRSDANTSQRRRLAWIVRYCPTGTRVQPGLRGAFDKDYYIMPVAGRGAAEAAEKLSKEIAAQECSDIYRPCYGNKQNKAQQEALKK
eukprot:gnl/TRDRNA2_/TRDRNA2_196726_c0_seq1.p1 gnl/TRDRNA2_/TRDRNA2_196726_c0~~gnl/TRDRNA2_/TRDRNA2_196726_c0_seq1.p1  ORF type:complete len:340 (-),score=58.84 gnl/TRDRNA2_/TRDRNA2_196726_c0_seq1:123-1094(-)